MRDASPVADAGGAVRELAFKAGAVAGLPIELKARTDLAFNVKVRVPADARPGEDLYCDVVQRDVSGQVVGGVRIKVVVK